jgi:two-component system, OmpR family, phosphate regulon response regulator PhoB
MKKILLIEDEKVLSNMYAKKLNSEGFDTKEVDNGSDGIKASISFKPDIILLDYRLPDINGLEIIAKIKENRETADIPIIVFSNYVNEEDKATFINQGAKDVFFKYEMKPETLIDKIKLFM